MGAIIWVIGFRNYILLHCGTRFPTRKIGLVGYVVFWF